MDPAGPPGGNVGQREERGTRGRGGGQAKGEKKRIEICRTVKKGGGQKRLFYILTNGNEDQTP